MSRRLSLTPQSRADIKEIRDYIASYSKEAARIFNVQIVGVLSSLCDMPLMGRKRDDLSPDLYGFVSGKYIVFYRLKGSNTLEIVRVLHSARDMTSIFN